MVRTSKVASSANTSEPESGRRATRGRAASSRKKPEVNSEADTELEVIEEDVTVVITKPTRGRKKTAVRAASPPAESDVEIVAAPSKNPAKGKGKTSKAAPSPTDTEEEPAPVRKGQPKGKAAKAREITPPPDPDNVSDDDLLIGPPKKATAKKRKSKVIPPSRSPPQTATSEVDEEPEPEPLPTRKRVPPRASRQTTRVVSVTRSKAASIAESEDVEEEESQANRSRAPSRTASKQSTAKSNGKRAAAPVKAQSDSEPATDINEDAIPIDDDDNIEKTSEAEEPPKAKVKPRAKTKAKAKPKAKTKATSKSTRAGGAAKTRSVSASSAAETDDAEMFESAAESQSEAEPVELNSDFQEDVDPDFGMAEATPQPVKSHRGQNNGQHSRSPLSSSVDERSTSSVPTPSAEVHSSRTNGKDVLMRSPRANNGKKPSQASGSGSPSRLIAPIPKVAKSKISIATPVKVKVQDQSEGDIVEWFPNTAQKVANWKGKGKGKEVDHPTASGLNGRTTMADKTVSSYADHQMNGVSAPSTPHAPHHARTIQPIASPTPRSNASASTVPITSPPTPPPQQDDVVDIIRPPDETFTEEELAMTVEEWINYEIMRQHAAMEAEGKKSIQAFLDDAEKTRNMIRTL